MKVRSADLYRLIEESWDKLQDDYGENFKSMNQNFFDRLALHIQEDSRNKYKLKGATLYKQYFLKIKNDSSQTDFIGVTPMYLSALAYFLYKQPFEEIGINQPLSQVEEEVPEFPSYHASFPSTPTIPLKMMQLKKEFLKSPCFSKKTSSILKNIFKKFKTITDTTVWYKDESINPNGTHKDRMAWEIYLWYDNEIKRQINTPGEKISLKSLSLISSGSAAYSVQKLLKNRGFPNLHVLIDKDTSRKLIEFLESNDCKVFPVDLDKEELDSNKILELTNNIDGIDLTYSPEFNESRKVYYDWLSYEVLNQNPNCVFSPFGTGDLYKNIITRNAKEMDKKVFSKRFFGDKKILSKCNFMGAASDNKKTKMKMLYSAFQNKTINNTNDIIVSPLIEKQSTGENSKVLIVNESYIDAAIDIAKYFNITCEPSGISGLALFFQMLDRQEMVLNEHDKVIIINTGKSITSNYY